MSLKLILHRIEDLESLYRRDRITVLAALPDGETRPMTVDEMLQQGAGFCRILAGSDLHDFDRILDNIAKQSVIE